MKLEDIRANIDTIDTQITDLFKQRMELALEVAKAKQEGSIPVLNKSREKEIIRRVSDELPEDE